MLMKMWSSLKLYAFKMKFSILCLCLFWISCIFLIRHGVTWYLLDSYQYGLQHFGSLFWVRQLFWFQKLITFMLMKMWSLFKLYAFETKFLILCLYLFWISCIFLIRHGVTWKLLDSYQDGMKLNVHTSYIPILWIPRWEVQGIWYTFVV